MKKPRKPAIGSALIAGMENTLAHARGRKRAARKSIVGDNPEWTAKDFRRARPIAEVLPGVIAATKNARGSRSRKAPR
jgi:hypothetical protein